MIHKKEAGVNEKKQGSKKYFSGMQEGIESV